LKCLYQDRTEFCHVRVYESYEYRIFSVCTIYSKILELFRQCGIFQFSA